jgi:hypothetical protein
MSIRRVTCPSCHASANVMATMTNIKCPSCGAVWDVNNPVAVKPAAAEQAEEPSSDSHVPLIAGLAGVVVFLAIAGLAIIFLLPTKDPPAPSQVDAVPSDTAVATYREVKLPESTRQKIYFDYRRMVASSTEAKLLIPKGSPVQVRLQETLETIVQREITHFALIYKVSEDDIMQIVAEGDAKKWPGSKKQEKKNTAS